MAKRHFTLSGGRAGFADFLNPHHELTLADLANTHPLIAHYLSQRHGKATVETYARLQRDFEAWCAEHDRIAVPASTDTLLAFIDDRKGRWGPNARYAAITAIGHLHVVRGHAFHSRCIRALLKTVHGRDARMPRQAAALEAETLRLVASAIPATPIGLRDKALLLLGFAAALRPCEIVGLDLGARTADGLGTIIFVPEGIRILLHRTKVDQGERGIEKLVVSGCDPCPVKATTEWLKIAGISSGAVLRHLRRNGAVTAERLKTGAVRRIVKSRVAKAFVREGLAPEEAARKAAVMSGYSLRAGFVTSAVRANIEADDIVSHVGWVNGTMLVRYTRQADNGDPHLVSQVFGG